MLRARPRGFAAPLQRGTGSLLGSRLDLAGVVILAAAVAWTFGSARLSGGDPVPVAGVFLAGAGGVLLGRLGGRRMRWAAPLVVAAGAAALFVASGPDLLSESSRHGPFGYSNATGAMAALGAASALMLAAERRGGAGSGIAAIAALAFGTIPFLIQSRTPAVLVLALPVVALSARDRDGARVVVRVAALGFLAALMVTVVLGSGQRGDAPGRTVDRVVDATITDRRVTLWGESIEIMTANPLSGVGPGRFGMVSPTALADRDAVWAHNEFLQQGAEQGVPGLLILAAVFLWGFVRLWARPEPDVVTALAAVALATLGIHACVDYVLRFPEIVVAAGLLLGAGVAAGPEDVGAELGW